MLPSGSCTRFITDGEGGVLLSGSCTRLKRVQNPGTGGSPSLLRVDLSDTLAAFKRALISPEFASEVSLLGLCITRKQTILTLLLI